METNHPNRDTVETIFLGTETGLPPGGGGGGGGGGREFRFGPQIHRTTVETCTGFHGIRGHYRGNLPMRLPENANRATVETSPIGHTWKPFHLFRGRSGDRGNREDVETCECDLSGGRGNL